MKPVDCFDNNETSLKMIAIVTNNWLLTTNRLLVNYGCDQSASINHQHSTNNNAKQITITSINMHEQPYEKPVA